MSLDIASAAPDETARELQAAVDDALGAVLGDKDVSEITAVEGGLLEVVRRGRRERLQLPRRPCHTG